MPCALPFSRLGRGGDRFGNRAIRSHRPHSNLSHRALGLLAVDGLLLGRCGLRCHPRNRLGRCDRDHRIPVGWLAASLRSLGSPKDVEGYHDITRHPDAQRIPGLVLFRWDAPLFFANAELFKERVLAAVAGSPSSVRWFVVAAEPVTSVDVTAADVLVELDETLHAKGIDLSFAELKDPVKDKLKRFGLFAQIGEDSFFPTVESAVRSYMRKHPAEQ